MKNVISTAALYIGLVIGAGFASGREILEFFSLKNRNDMTGVVLAGMLFSFIAYMILVKAKKENTDNFYVFTERTSGRLGYYVKTFMFLHMFAGFFVMLSAGGSLCSMELGIEKKYGIIFLTVLCFVIFIFGMKGIAMLNTVLVPLMIAGISVVCIISAFDGSISAFSPSELFYSVKNNFLTSAVCYVSYNTINAGAVLVPYALKLSKRQIKRSVILSGAVLGILVFLVWITLNRRFDSVSDAEFPMYDVASLYGQLGRYSYFCVLMMAICTTAASSGFGVLSAFSLKTKSELAAAAAILCLLAAPLAALKFSALVANVYSFFGYVGIVWLIILCVSFVKG